MNMQAGSSSQIFVRLIRHGQAQHNVLPEEEGRKIFDPHLTELGKSQAFELSQVFRPGDVDAVIVSPLRRTLQTATAIFQDDLTASNNFSFVAVELCRENFGEVECDKRNTVTAYKKDFGHLVHFSHMAAEEDVWWTTVRESGDYLRARAKRFLDFLQQRKERKIAVVSHHGFLRALFKVLREIPDSNADVYEGDDFRNCEVRDVVLRAAFNYNS